MWTTPVGRLDLGPLVPLEDVLDDERVERRAPPPTCSACFTVGAIRSTQTAAFGWREQLGEPGQRGRAVRFADRVALDRRRPGSCPAVPARRSAPSARPRRDGPRGGPGQRARPGSGASRPSASGPPARSTRSRRSRPVRRPAYASGPAPAAQRQARRDGHGGHAGRHDEQPDHDRGGLARRPVLERLDDERVAQRPIAQRLGDELEVRVGRRVDLVVEPVDGRRAVGRQDRQPDRHPEHPRDGHDRRRRPERAPPGGFDRGRRAWRDRQPEPEPEDAERERDGLQARSSDVHDDIASRPADAQRDPDQGDEPERHDADDEARTPARRAPSHRPARRAPAAARPARRRARDRRRPRRR